MACCVDFGRGFVVTSRDDKLRLRVLASKMLAGDMDPALEVAKFRLSALYDPAMHCGKQRFEF
jgi:hypothetical protein